MPPTFFRLRRVRALVLYSSIRPSPGRGLLEFVRDHRVRLALLDFLDARASQILRTATRYWVLPEWRDGGRFGNAWSPAPGARRGPGESRRASQEGGRGQAPRGCLPEKFPKRRNRPPGCNRAVKQGRREKQRIGESGRDISAQRTQSHGCACNPGGSASKQRICSEGRGGPKCL